MKVLLTGGTGFIGRAVLQKLIEAGHKVTLLTRHPGSLQWLNKNYVTVIHWDGKKPGDWADGADSVINLAGESIAAKRWSAAQKKKIADSRIHATEAVVDAIKRSQRKPSILINASAVGFYGDVPDGDVNESSPKGRGFLSDTCELWEKTALQAQAFGVRVVLMRFGVVLGEGGGALTKIVPPFQMFIGGPVGSGSQWFPWVHRDDAAGAVIFALGNQNLSGPVNITSPESVNMKQFSAALGSAMNRPSWAPVPAFAIRLMLGEMADMLLTGQKAVPKKLTDAGFKFSYPKLDEALSSIFHKKGSDPFFTS